MSKLKVALFGASGTMDFQAFKELWKRRYKYEIVILVLPTEQKLKLFRQYEQAAGVPIIEGAGVAEGKGLKIVWGDPQITPMLKKPSRGWSSLHQH